MPEFSFISPISIFGPVEKFVFLSQQHGLIELQENFQKKSMRNRTVIMTANGVQTLSIPLRRGKTKENIKDVIIAYDENWVKDYIEAMRSAYANSAYFDHYFPRIESIINTKHKFLMDMFYSSFEFLSGALDLNSCSFTEEYVLTYEHIIDLRNSRPEDHVILKEYFQVFSDRFPFTKGMSILDCLFNTGPETDSILKSSTIHKA